MIPAIRMRLILFDIDGTLLSCGPQVAPLFQEALGEAFGSAGDLNGYSFAGKTDDQIVQELMGAAGLPAQWVRERLPRMRRTYVEKLERGLERSGMTLLPAVLETLNRLQESGEVTLGLLTGNWERGARIKLSRFDLNRFFAFGAFGDGVEDRRQLPPLALARARRFAGRSFDPAETLIVGDSALDVECAHAHGISALGVATGPTTALELEAAGADWVVPDLASADFWPAVASA